MNITLTYLSAIARLVVLQVAQGMRARQREGLSSREVSEYSRLGSVDFDLGYSYPVVLPVLPGFHLPKQNLADRATTKTTHSMVYKGHREILTMV